MKTCKDCKKEIGFFRWLFDGLCWKCSKIKEYKRMDEEGELARGNYK